FRQYRYGRRGGMHAALSLGFGHPLNAMPAALVSEMLIDAGASDVKDDLLEPAQIGGRSVHDLHRKAVLISVVLVHLEEIPGEQGGLVPAGTGPDFHDH